MSVTTVAWAKGSVFKADPNLALREIQAVDQQWGGVAPAGQLVERARDPSSVLHNDFEWDDSIAAAKQRVATEKQIKRSLVYVTSSDVPESFAPTKLRVFTNVSHTNDLGKTVRSYVSTIEAMKDAEFRAQILANAERDLEQFVNKYDQLTELAGVLDPIKTHLEGG